MLNIKKGIGVAKLEDGRKMPVQRLDNGNVISTGDSFGKVVERVDCNPFSQYNQCHGDSFKLTYQTSGGKHVL